MSNPFDKMFEIHEKEKLESKRLKELDEAAKKAMIKMAEKGWFSRHPKITFILGAAFGAILSALTQKYLFPLLGL